MPFTKHPLDYPVNRLLLEVGMALCSWIPQRVRAWTDPERRDWERELTRRFRLEAAVADQLLNDFAFHWAPGGFLETLELRVHPRVRRTPGVGQLQRCFFPRRKTSGRPPGRKTRRWEGEAGERVRDAAPPSGSPEPAPGSDLPPASNPPYSRTRGRPRRHPREDTELPVLDVPLSTEPHLLVLDAAGAEGADAGAARLPMVCAGAGCFWAALCPYMQEEPLFVGRRCPVEALELARQWAVWGDERGLAPETPSERAQAAEWVRLELQIRRCDMRLQVEGMVVPEVRGVIQKTGEPVTQLGPHPLLMVQETLLRRQERILAQFQATRAAQLAGREEAPGLHPVEILHRLRDWAAAQLREAGAPETAEPDDPAAPAGDTPGPGE